MQIKELKLKEAEELKQLLKDVRKGLDDLKFKSNQGQLKNVREMRAAKKDIARVMTALKEKK
ncbi:MAG: 50S ribosomal protein L29 [Parcubacteria group bacterium ADurb.Bin326]|nr:MAG: 50S ribosomal protein L29 [Parcubacteria group bacterium ADurb.Bin326]